MLELESLIGTCDHMSADKIIEYQCVCGSQDKLFTVFPLIKVCQTALPWNTISTRLPCLCSSLSG